jgi:hypothetical protein
MVAHGISINLSPLWGLHPNAKPGKTGGCHSYGAQTMMPYGFSIDLSPLQGFDKNGAPLVVTG